jgi:hypothetical protein
LAVPAQIHRHHPVISAEVLELGREVGMVARQAMHKEHGWLPDPRLFVEELHPVATQPSHMMCLLCQFPDVLEF